MTYWLNETTRTFLSRGYLRPGQSAEERIDEIAHAAARVLNDPSMVERVREVILNGWASLASPVWSNFGTDRGLPISCNNSYFEDDMDSILMKVAEVGKQTQKGAGTSAYMGELRPRGSAISVGGTAFGPVHFMGLLEATIDIVSQSNIRRGNCAVYLPVEHPDIAEFLECREEGNPIQHLSLGVCITDAWMEAMLAGDRDKQVIWARIVRKKMETGYPYIFWTDAVNRAAPDVYQDKGIRIHSSNLCSEIALASGPDESFVCCLSSMNLLHYDEWRDTHAVDTMVRLLDAVMTEYIEKTADMPLMRTAHNFARRQRAIGLGTLGWHSLLQSKMIAWESMEAKLLNTQVHADIASQARRTSEAMISEGYEEPELLQGYGRRHTTLMAIAPTASSSIILGQVSPSIEPLNSNYFQNDSQKGTFTYRNPYLERLLDEKSRNTPEVWRDILLHGGSVQHLDWLTDHERAVFKTFDEISQWEIVVQAAGRQKYIDQSQSLNLKIHPDAPAKDVSNLMIEAWRLGIKTLYYQHSTSKAQALARSLLACVSCEA